MKENNSILDETARVLIERETIYADEVDELLSGKSAVEVMAAMDEREAKRKQKDKEALERREAARKAEEEKLKQMNDDLTNKVMNAYSNTNKNEQVNKTNNEIKIQKTETPEQTETANNDVDKPKKDDTQKPE